MTVGLGGSHAWEKKGPGDPPFLFPADWFVDSPVHGCHDHPQRDDNKRMKHAASDQCQVMLDLLGVMKRPVALW